MYVFLLFWISMKFSGFVSKLFYANLMLLAPKTSVNNSSNLNKNHDTPYGQCINTP